MVKKASNTELLIEQVDEALSHWMKLNQLLMKLGEAECLQLLRVEQRQRARLRVLLRIYHRYSRLRGIREKLELSQGARG